MTTFGRNLLLSVLLLCAAAYFLHAGDQGIAASLVLAVVTLWSRSGRVKEGVLGLLLAGLLPTLCSCSPQQVGLVNIERPEQQHVAAPPISVLGGINSDYVRLTTQAALPSACTTPYGCLYLKSADALPRLVDPSGNEYIAGTTWRARQVAGTPGSVATGDIWHDTTTGFLMWRSSGGNVTIGNTGGWVTIDTAQTITGVKTISGGLLASGTGYFDFSGGSGIFKPPTGAATFGGSSNAFTNAVTLNGAVTAGDAAADIVTVKGTLRVENTANTFYATLTHAATANRAVTLPDAAGEICLIGATQTLTNKTIGVSQLSGAVAVANGGTNSSTALNNNRIMVSSGGAIVEAGALTNGQLLIGSTGAAPVGAAIAGTAPVTVTNGAGSVTVSLALASSLSDGGGVLGVASNTIVYARHAAGGVAALGAATVYLVAPGQNASATEVPLSIVTRSSTSRNLRCYLGTAPGGADTVVFTVRENASDQILTCTITGAATTCSDTSNTFGSAAGDRISIKAVSSAGTAAGALCSWEETN